MYLLLKLLSHPRLSPHSLIQDCLLTVSSKTASSLSHLRLSPHSLIQDCLLTLSSKTVSSLSHSRQSPPCLIQDSILTISSKTVIIVPSKITYSPLLFWKKHPCLSGLECCMQNNSKCELSDIIFRLAIYWKLYYVSPVIIELVLCTFRVINLGLHITHIEAILHFCL